MEEYLDEFQMTEGVEEIWEGTEEAAIKPLFTLLGRPVTAYAVCIAAAVALGLLLLWWNCRRMKIKPGTAGTLGLLLIPLGLLGARLFYVVSLISMFEEIGFEFIPRMWDGGYALWGAVGGCALAVVIGAKVTRQPVARLMDACAAPAALTIAVSRLGEYFSGEGYGPMVENPAFQRFPFAVANEWEEWSWAVFMLEALAALVILIVLMRKERPAGNTARLFLLLYSACQVLLESMRRDQFLRWMFVRVSQLASAIMLGLLIIFALVRWGRRPQAERRMSGRKVILLCLAFAACIGICVWMEFAVDKSPDLPVWACYLISMVSCAGLGSSAYQLTFKS